MPVNNTLFVILRTVAIILCMAWQAYPQDACQTALQDTGKMDVIAEFWHVSGAGAFLDLANTSSIGKKLSSCPAVADDAWMLILKAGRDAQKTLPSAEVELRTSLLLAIYGEQVDAGHVEKLKEFIRLRPWKLGFIFASSLAVDSLLAYNHDPQRHADYHAYGPDEMERAMRTYAQ